MCCSNTAAARNLAQITEGRCLSSHMSTILMASSGVQWKNHHYHDYFQPELLSLHYQFLLAGGWNIFPPQLVLVLWNQDFLQSVKYCFFWRASSWKAKMETVSRGSKFWAPLFHKWSLQSCNISKPPVTRSEPWLWGVSPVCTVLYFLLMVEISSLLIVIDRQLLLSQLSHLWFHFAFTFFTVCKYIHS